jgi:hypothetical protein
MHMAHAGLEEDMLTRDEPMPFNDRRFPFLDVSTQSETDAA